MNAAYINKFLIAIMLVVGPLTLPMYSQTKDEVDISNLPYFNFGKGVGLTSPDSVFQLNLRFRMQNRIGYVKNEGLPSVVDGQIRRLRLRIDGYIGNPKFAYALQLSFAPGDVGELQEGSNINIIRDAVVFYRHSARWNFGFGQTKLPGNRQRVNSSGALQLTDRTINNARFNIDRDFGIFINYINEKKDRFSWNVKSAISTGDGRNYTSNLDNGLAYTSKVELLPFGAFKKDGAYFEGDILREQTPKLMVSGVIHYNHKAKREAGVLGEKLDEKRNLTSIFLDAVFKYQGICISSSYMSRATKNPIVKNINGDITGSIYTGHGFDFQPSYTFENNFELILRYSNLFPEPEISALFPKQQQYTIGVTKYIWEHAFKLQLEATLDRLRSLDQSTLQNYYFRFQIEMGI